MTGLAALLSIMLGVVVALNKSAHGLSGPSVVTWIAAVILGITAWSTLKEHSPVGLVITGGLLVYGAASALLYRPTAEEFQGINALPAKMAVHTASYKYLLLFLVPSAGALVGAWIGSYGAETRTRSLAELIRVDLPTWSLAAPALLLGIYIYGIGPRTLMHAEHYLAISGPGAAVKLGQILGPIAVLLCGYFTFSRKSSTSIRLVALALAVAYETVYFAVGTRLFAIWFPLMFIGGVLGGGWSQHRQRLLLVGTIAIAIFAVHIPLGLRGLPEHGLLASWSYLRHEPDRVINSYDPINNVLFGAPLSLYVGEEIPSLPKSYLATATNPLPSNFTNWDEIRGNLTLTVHAPYSAIGELRNYGWGVLFGVIMVISAGLSWLGRWAGQREDLVGGVCTVTLMGSAGLLVLQATEYNLRTVCRTAIYTSVLVLLTMLVGRRAHQSVSGPRAADSRPYSDR